MRLVYRSDALRYTGIPMEIAGVKLQSPFVAAPMAGITSPAMRLWARRGGAALVYTEMVSAKGLCLQKKKTLSLCRALPEERPLALQLFGGDPEDMAQAAALVREMPVDILDLNLGCPVKKVRRQGAGSALLEDIPRAAEVVEAASRGWSGPVTVKLRLGPARDELERMLPPLIKAGAAAVCLHARTTRQGFSGRADWEAIARLASWCPVPVIGNGDVKNADDAVRMLNETGCAAVMIGRAAIGDPWIFGRAARLWLGGRAAAPSLSERREALLAHAELARSLGGEGHALHMARVFMMHFSKGRPDAAAFRRSAGGAKELAPFLDASTRYFQRLAEVEP